MSPSPTLPKARKRPAPASPPLALRRPALRPISLAVCLLGVAPASFGLPTGAVQTSGQTTLTQSKPGQLDILQSTPRASLDWTNFSIGVGERVNVVQPDRTSILLNRVVGENPSLIYGALQSNGSVWLINPRGIVFGASSRVDVGGLVASTLAISNDALASGRIQLGAGAGGAGELRSEGQITAVDGTVALVSPQLLHSGQITARRVGLAAASEVLVDVEGDGLVFFNVRNDRLDARLALLGGVRADGGTAEIRAAARSGFADTVLNMDGVVQARGLGTRAGRIVVDGGASGITRVAGTLDASSAAGSGGSVTVLGEKVLLDPTARLDASGAGGGGSVRVGGDFQGRNPELRNATRVTVREGAQLHADALVQGDGGRVIVWSDDSTVFNGRATATGGAQGGDGGLVETSGKKQLGVLSGSVDVRAPQGRPGQWLLDPADIVVATGGGATAAQVDQFADPGTTLTVSPGTLNGVGGNVTLQATNSITVTDAIALGTSNASLTLQANSRIDLNASLSTTNGAISLTTGAAGLGQLTGTSVNAGNDTITINGGTGNVTLAGALQTSNTTGNAIRITGAANLQVGNLATGGANGDITLSFSGTGTQASGSAITAGNLVKQGAGTLVLSSAGNTYTGGTVLSAGTLRVDGANATAGTLDLSIGANTLDITNGASVPNTVVMADGARITSSAGGGTLGDGGTLSIGNNDILNLSSTGGALTVARVIDDTNNNGRVTIGSGTVVLQGANAYVGNTTVTAGTLRIDGVSATAGAGGGNIVLGSNTLDISGGASVGKDLSVANGATITSSTGNGTLATGGTLNLGDNVGITLSGGAASTLTVARGITDANNNGTVTVTAGTVALTNNNSFAGTATINGGTLRVAGAGADTGDGSIALLAGTLDITTGGSVTRALTVSNGGTVSSSTGGGTLGGAGALTLADGATLNLAGGAASTLTLDRVIAPTAGAGLESVGITGGTVRLNQNNTYTGTTTLSGAATLLAGDGATAGSVGTGGITLGAGATLRIDRNDTVTLAQNIGGATAGDGTLAKINTGTLVLTGSNTYGATSITGGTLQVGNNTGTGSLGSGDITLASPAALNIDRTGTLTIAGAFTGDGTFTQAGTGTTVLSGNSSASFTGAVNVTDGTLGLSGANASVGSSTIALGANRLDISDGASVGNTITVANGARITSSTGNGTLAGGTLNLGAGVGLTLAGGASSALTVTRIITDTANDATVTVSGGTVVMQAAHSYGGNTTVSGGTLRIDADGNNAGDGSIVLGANRLDITGGLTVVAAVSAADGASITSSTGNGTLGGPGALTLADGATLNLAGGAASTLTLDRVIAPAAGAGLESVGITGGTVLLKKDNTYAGNTTLSAGATLVAGDGATAGSVGGGDITLGAGATLRIDRSDAVTLAQNILGATAGDGTLAKINTGTLVLTGSNSYGVTSITGGTLQVGNNSATGSLGSGAITLASPAALNVDRTGTLTIAGGFIGDGTFTQAGTGTTVLTGDSSASFTGAVNVTGGTLGLSGANASVGSSTIALGANRLDITDGASVANTITVANGARITSSTGNGTLAGGTLNLGAGVGLTLAGGTGSALTVTRSITDTANDATVTVSGGTVVMQAAHSYGGNTTVSGGTLRIAGAGNNAGDGSVLLGGNTLDLSGGVSFTADISAGTGATLSSSSGGGTLAAAGALTLADGAALNLAGGAGSTLTVQRGIALAAGAPTESVNVTGGSVVLQGVNSYEGGSTLSGGSTLRLDGVTAGSGGIAIGANTLDIAGGASVANTVTIANGGSITSSTGNGTLAGGSALSLGNNVGITLGGGAGSTLTVARAITDTNNNATLAISGGTVVLADNNSYGGSTTIAASITLAIGSGGAAGSLGSGGVSIGSAGVLQIDRDNSAVVTLANTITGAGRLVVGGGATAVLSADNGYSGGTTVNAGTLRITGATADAGSGAITLGANTLDIAGGASIGNDLTLANAATLTSSSGGGTLAAGTALSLGNAVNLNLGSAGGGTLTLVRGITDTANNATLTITGGTVVLQGNNSHDGGTNVNAGTLRISGAGTAGNGTLALGANTLDITGGASIGAALTLDNGASITSSSGGGTLAGGAALSLGNGVNLSLAGAAGSTLTVVRAIGDTAANGSVAVTGGTVALQGLNTYGGGTTVSAGTLRVDGATATAGAATGAITLGANTLDIAGGANVGNPLTVANGASITNSAGAGTLGGANTLTLPDASTLNLSSAGTSLTISRDIADANNNATVAVLFGNVLLLGTNSFGGDINVTSGTLLVNGTGASLGDGAINLGANTLDISGGVSLANVLTVANGATITSNSGGGTLAAHATPLSLPAGATLNLSSAGGGTLTLARVITDGAGTGNLNVSTGTVALTANNSVDGNTAIGASTTLVVGNGGATGTLPGGTVSIGNAGVLNIFRDGSSTVTLGSVISGAGSLLLTGGATLVLGADNAYSGGTTVSAGTLRISGAAADAGSGSIALGANTLDITGGASLANAVTVGSGASITSSSGSGTLATGTALNLGNAAGLFLGSSGGGSLTLQRGIIDAANNATVTVTGGTVVLQEASSFDGGTSVNAGTLRIDGTSASAGTGTLALAAGSTLDIAGGASIANAVTLAGNGNISNSSGAGTLAFNAAPLTLAGGSTLTLGSSGSGLAIARVIDDGLGIAAVNVGAGTVALSAANSFDGGSTVANAATLRLTNSAAAGTGAITLQGASSVLDVGGGASVGNALNLNASGATLANSSGTGTLTGAAITLADGFNLILSSTGAGLTLARVIDDGAGNASVATSGGTLTLAAANSYSGGTTVGSGTLRVGGPTASAGSGAIALGANTLDITGGASVTNAVTIADGASITSSSGSGMLAAGTALSLGNNAGLTLAGAAGSTLTVARSIVDTNANGRITASGGSVVLAADNSYGGSTTIAAGATLAAGAGGASGTLGSGTVANAGVLRIDRNTASTVNLAAAISGAGSLEQVGTGTTVLLADNAYGNTLVSNGVLQVGNGGATGTLGSGSITVNNPGALRFNRAGTLTVPGTVSGTGRLEVAGSGVAELTAAANYSGGTNVLAGSLRISGAAASAGSGAIALAAGTTLDIAGGASVANVLTVGDGASIINSSGSGTLAANVTPVLLAGGNTLNLSSTGSGLALNRSISDGLGVASVTVGGTAGVSFGAVQAYDGSTQLSGGTLTLGVDNALAATSAVVVDGGTLALGTRNLAVAAVSLRSGALTGSTGVLTSASSFDLREGNISAILAGGAAVGLNKTTAGTLSLSGANSYGGATTVSAGSLVLGANNVLPDGSAVSVSNATLDMGSRSDSVASLALNSGTLVGSGTLTAATYTVATATLDANLGAGTLNSSGAVALNGTAAATSVNVNGGTLTLGSADRLANTAAVDVASGATLALGGADTVGSLTLRGALAGTGTLTAASYALNGGSTGATADLGAGALTSTGSSQLAGRSAAGTVAVNSGTLTLAAADRLADTAAVSVAALATLQLGGNDSVGSLNLSGALTGTGTLSAANVSFNTGASTAAAANLGAGTLTVLGNSTLGGTSGAGTVNINAGGLSLDAADRLADSAAVSVASGASLLLAGDDSVATLALAGTLGGSGTLTASGYTLATGAATLATANLGTGVLNVNGSSALAGSSAAGTVNVNSGTFSLASADRLADTAAVTVASGATLALGGNDSINSLTLAGTLSGVGHTLTSSDRSTLQAGANVAANLGSGRMDVAGNATLAGSSGATAVNLNAGTLSLGSAGRLAGGATVTVSSGATLALGGAETVQALDIAGTLSGATHKLTAQQYTLRTGASVNAKLGTGQLDSEGNATLAGTADAQTVNVNTGTLSLAAGDLLADNADVTVAALGTLTLNGNDTVGSLALSGTVNGIGTLNAGTYVLTEGNYDLDLGTGNLTSRGRSRLNGSSGAAIVTVQTGTLTLGSAGRFTQAPAVTVNTGATLNLGGNETFGTLAGAGTVGLGTATLTTGSGGDSSFSGSLTGAGGISKVGNTSFLLAGSNAYTGSTLLQAGTLRVAGTLASATLQVQAGALVLEAANRLADNASVTVASGASFTLTGDDTITSLNLAGTLDGSGTLTANSYALSSGNVLANLGGGTLNSLGSSRLQGTAAATQLNVNGGTLTLVSANRLTGNPVTTVAAAALLDMGGDQTLGALAGAGNVGLGSFTLSTGAAADSRFDGVLAGTGGLVKQGSSSFTLGGANAYGGATRVAAGNLLTAGANVLPDGSAITVDNGATLTLGGLDTVASLALSGTLAGGGTLTAASYNLDGGSANANLGAGALNSIGNSSLGGAAAAASVAVNGGTLTLTAADRLADGAQVNVASGATLRLTGNDSVARVDIAGTLDGSGTLTAPTLVLNGARIDAGLAGGALASSGNSTLNGVATVATLQVDGGTLSLGSAQRLAGNPLLTLATGATLQLAGDQTLGTLAGTGAVNLGTATLGTGLGGDSSFAGLISGSGGLLKQGASSFTLTSDQAYTGSTRVAGGTLVVGGTLASSSLQVAAGTALLSAADRLANGASVDVATGATLTLSGSDTVASLTLAGTLGGSGTLSAATYAMAGGTSNADLGAGALSSTGASRVNGLAGAQSVTIDSGTLTLGSDERLSALPAVDVRAGATLQLAGSQTAGTLSGAGTVDLGSHTLRSGAAGDSSFAGALVGTGGLIKQGSSTFTLAGASSYSGSTRVEAGTLALAAADRLGDTTAVNVASGATLTLAGNDTAGSLALAGNLSGTGMLTAATYALDGGSVNAALGSGALSSTGNSTLAGTAAASTVAVNAGTLTLAGAERLADGATVTVATGATLALSGNERIATLTLGGTLGGSGTLTAASYALNGATVNADLGAGGLTSNGASTLNGLSAANTVAVNTGLLSLGSAQRFSAAPTVTVASGAALRLGGDLSTGSLAGAGTIDLSSFTLGTGTLGGDFAGALTGTGGLVKLGTSDFTLSGANTYTGSTRVAGGALHISGTLASATVEVDGGTLDLAGSNRLAPNAAVTVRNGAAMNMGGDQAIASLALTGTLGGTGTLSAAQVALDNGTLAAGAGMAAGHLGSNGTSALNGNFTAGTLAVETGSLSLGALPGAAARGTNGAAAAVASGATLRLNGEVNMGSLALAGTLTGTGPLRTTAGVSLDGATVDADLQAAGGLRSAGNSTLNATLTGDVSVSAGTLTLGAADRINGAVTVDAAGTLGLGGDQVFNTLAGAGNVNLNGFTLATGRGGDSTFAGVLAGSSGIVKQGSGNFTLSGANTYAGNTRVEGGTLTVAGTLLSSALQVNSGTLALAASERLADTATVNVAGGAALSLAGNETVASLLLAGTLNGSGTLNAATYTLTGGSVVADLGSGVFTSTGNSTLAGTAAAAQVRVDSGSLTLSGANRLADNAAVTVATGATLAVGATDTINSLLLNGTLAGSGTLTAATYLLDSGTAQANLGGGALTSRGSSTLAGNAAVATATVESGTLVLASPQRFSALPAVQVNNAATLALTGDQAFGMLVGAGDLALASFTLSVGSGGDSIFAGVIGGSGGLIKQGSASTFTLTGANSYTGLSTVQAGTLQVGDGGSTGSLASSAYQLQGTLRLQRSDDVTLAAPVAGSGGIEQAGTGRLLFSGNNKTYTGDTTVTRGELATAGAEELPDGGATVVRAAGRLTLAGNETVAAVDADGAISLAGNLLASGDLLMRGAVTAPNAVLFSGQRITATNEGNRFGASVALDARGAISLSSGMEAGNARALLLGTVNAAAGGRIDAGLTTLGADANITGGTLELVSAAPRVALTPDAELLGKQATALPIAFADDAVLQGAAGRINVAAGAGLAITTGSGASVQLLRPDNVVLGSLSVVTGAVNTEWLPNATPLSFGAAATTNFAVQSRVRLNGSTLNVGGNGVVADVVNIRADRLATVGTAEIVARLPFDSAAGSVSALPGLTLELTPESYNLSFPFGGIGPDAGLRVNVGSRSYGNRTLPLDAGFVTVLPRNGARGTTAVLLTGPVVNPGGGYRFFFDGAGSQTQIPVFYNGVLPTTPQVENSISATVSVSEGARKERFDEAVRTENVAVRLRAGVIAEVGPAPSATTGTEGLRVPAGCTPAPAKLLCAAAQ